MRTLSNLKPPSQRPSLQGLRVAFLMSVYREERPEFLRQSLESMCRQTYGNLDIHIFEDGNLGEELSQVLFFYGGRHSNLFFHRHAENRGLAVCLNELIEKLKDSYDYFARMDSDDVSFPDRVQKQVEFLEAHPEIDVVGGSILDIDESGRYLKEVRYPEDHQTIVKFFKKRNDC